MQGAPAPCQPLQPPGFQACDAWQREAKEAKERALAADSARQLALQKKEEVEAQFRQLQEELEVRGMSTLPGLRGCSDIGAISLPKLQSLQSQLRLDLEAVDGVSPGFGSQGTQCLPLAVCGTGDGWDLAYHSFSRTVLLSSAPQMAGHILLPGVCAPPLLPVWPSLPFWNLPR